MGSLCNGSSEKPGFPDVDIIEVSSSEGMYQSSNPQMELTSSLRHLAPHKEVRSTSISEESVKHNQQENLNLFSLTSISRQVTDRTMKADFLKVTDSDLQFSSQNTFFRKLDDDISVFEKKSPPPQTSSLEKINSYNIKKRSYDSPAGPVYIDGDRAIHCADGTVFLEDGTLVGPVLEGNENIYFKRYTAEDQMGDLRTIFAEKLKEVQSSLGDQVPSLNDIVSTRKSERPW